MVRFLFLTSISVLFTVSVYAQPSPGGSTPIPGMSLSVTEEDGDPVCFGWQFKFADDSVTDNSDGTCSIDNLIEPSADLLYSRIDLDNQPFQSAIDSTTAFQILDADGGAPVLNADTVNEKVGIGTDSPSSVFHVKDTTAFSTVRAIKSGIHIEDAGGTPSSGAYSAALSFSAVGSISRGSAIASVQTGSDVDNVGLAFFGHGNVAGDPLVEYMRIDGNGDVGIGTDSPSTKLTIKGDAEILQVEDSGGGVSAVLGLNSDNTGFMSLSDSNHVQNVLITGKVGTNGFINNGANFGIGTDNPLAKLEVEGDVLLGDGLGAINNEDLVISNTAFSSMRLINRGTATHVWSNTNALFFEVSRVDISGRDYLGRIAFTSSDTAFTTTNPKTVAWIGGIAEETYSADDDGASGLVFYTASSNPGTGDNVASERMRIDKDGNVGIGTETPSANADLTLEGGVLNFKETTTPTADTDYGKIYTKSSNALFFQDGAGEEHILHGEAFSSLWFHGTATTATISAQNTFTKVTLFENEGDEDDSGNVVGDATTDDDMTINLAGQYEIDIQSSITNDGGGSAEFHTSVKIILNTAKTITDATNTTPIVITSVGHGLKSGDSVIQSGVITNTAANGDFSITRLTADTYSLADLAHVNVAGNGAYGGGGSVTSVIPGNIYIERIVSNTALGRGAAHGTYTLEVGDVLECVIVNQDGTDNLLIEQIQFGVERIGD